MPLQNRHCRTARVFRHLVSCIASCLCQVLNVPEVLVRGLICCHQPGVETAQATHKPEKDECEDHQGNGSPTLTCGCKTTTATGHGTAAAQWLSVLLWHWPAHLAVSQTQAFEGLQPKPSAHACMHNCNPNTSCRGVLTECLQP